MDNEECLELRVKMDALDEKLRHARSAQDPNPGAIAALVREVELAEDRYAAARRELIRQRYVGG